MSGRSRLLRCYPLAWRERYGEDLAAYLDDTFGGRLPFRAAASVVRGGLSERVRALSPLAGSVPAGERVRNGVLAVLTAWSAFVVAGASFAKLSEHYDLSLGNGSRTSPDVAYTAVQVAAGLAAVAVAAGVVLAIPTLLRFLAAGGWSQIRRRVLPPLAATVLTVCMTAAIIVWAHQLTVTQRNGGNSSYPATFVVWACLVVVTIGLWTAAAVATARLLTLPRRVLLAEGALATGVTAGMLCTLLAAAAWWATMASSAPTFLDTAASPWNPQLVGTLTLMALALAVATAAVIGIVRATAANAAGGGGDRQSNPVSG